MKETKCCVQKKHKNSIYFKIRGGICPPLCPLCPSCFKYTCTVLEMFQTRVILCEDDFKECRKLPSQKLFSIQSFILSPYSLKCQVNDNHSLRYIDQSCSILYLAVRCSQFVKTASTKLLFSWWLDEISTVITWLASLWHSLASLDQSRSGLLLEFDQFLYQWHVEADFNRHNYLVFNYWCTFTKRTNLNCFMII